MLTMRALQMFVLLLLLLLLLLYGCSASPVVQPTVSEHWRQKYHIPWTCST